MGIYSIAYFLLSVKTEGGIFISLVENIKALCVSRSMTLAELERTLGLGNGTIARWDKCEPGVIRVSRVADYFGVTVDELLKSD